MDKDDMIIESLTRINDKLDKHENKFDEIAMTLKKLVEVDMGMRELKNANKRIFQRLEKVEQTQIEKGCNVLNNYWSIRNEQLKKYDRIIDDFDEKIKSNDKAIKEFKDIPNKIFMRMIFVATATLTAWAIGTFFLDKH